ncbi:M15 family metallopeptidase [Rubeoparvulum massiliense]|uniref:M15 family metallopeptidase n=1 Tax=Rubeoparvulum massiliense TaxID=1631346 RepID=UPI00069EC6A5|nr:M15 family metallopeptidase [Rubeoparvulum massiliense]
MKISMEPLRKVSYFVILVCIVSSSFIIPVAATEGTESSKHSQLSSVFMEEWTKYRQALQNQMLHPNIRSFKAEQTGDKLQPVTAPITNNLLLLVNKVNELQKKYVPSDLVIPNVRFPFSENLEKKQLREPAAQALEELFNAAEQDGITLYAVSGYRSYQRQEVLFAYNVDTKGFVEANRVSAQPGQSEHQSGLAMDVSGASINFALEEEFAHTLEGEWVAQHAHEYGFIIRYPKDKEEITGYQYEPWHLRYVGVEIATIIHEKGVTLEEYLATHVLAQEIVQLLHAVTNPL